MPSVKRRICSYAFDHPDEHIKGYMLRYWLFNRYDRKTRRAIHPWIPLSARVHHILREDDDRALHDHPWNARTFILQGWYDEMREDGQIHRRQAGDTAGLAFGEFHRIIRVCPGGVTTLFVMGKYRGVWGFKVGDRKIPFHEYLAND
jgi:hypothetical protein